MSNEAAGVVSADRDGATAEGPQFSVLGRYRLPILAGLIALILATPTSHVVSEPLHSREWFQLVGTVAVIVLALWAVNSTTPRLQPTQWIGPSALLALSIALYAVGGAQWVGLLAVAAGLCGRFSRSRLAVVLTALACSAAILAVAAAHRESLDASVPLIVLPPVAGLLGYMAARRIETLTMLRRTRAELARAAVAEERLRIARDLHDLLGHSLSLITLKAELAGRLLPADPDRAAHEIADVQTVARQSLSDVRAAVAGFRQPDLAAELVAARQLLDAAGISSSITSPGPAGLSQEVDAVLAWAVREGTTNAVRHSRAARVTICVTAGPASAVAEITDDGPARPAALNHAAAMGRMLHPQQAPRFPSLASPEADRPATGWTIPALAGSGLAGLADRVRELGGELTAGTVQPHGFLLRVVVPIPPQAS